MPLESTIFVVYNLIQKENIGKMFVTKRIAKRDGLKCLITHSNIRFNAVFLAFGDSTWQQKHYRIEANKGTQFLSIT